MAYTIEQLEDRLDQLNEYEAKYDELTTGFVGAAELKELTRLAEEYSIEFDDWYSDRFEVEKELVRREK